jgi:methylglutaconyl-CoA hydratase
VSYLRVRREGVRGIVEIDRPDARNALDGDGWRGIATALEQHADDPAVRTVLVQATDSVFCGGADVDWMRRAEPSELAAVGRTLDAVAACPKPVVARVQGPVYGGGVGLAAACDLVVAAPDVRFVLSEVRLGVAPGLVSRAVIARIGGARFRSWALIARPVDAQSAAAAGLVDRVAAPGELDRAIDEVCEALCAGEPGALAAVKQLFPDGMEVGAAAELLRELRVRPAFAEGIAALREKRPPSWVRGD